MRLKPNKSRVIGMCFISTLEGFTCVVQTKCDHSPFVPMVDRHSPSASMVDRRFLSEAHEGTRQHRHGRQIERAEPEIVKAVDEGRMAVSTAALVATEPPEIHFRRVGD